MTQKFKNLHTCFINLCRILNDAPQVSSRGSNQKEVIFNSFSIEDPTDILINVPERKFSKTYAIAEWLWYLSANPNIDNIGKFAKIWKQIADENQKVESHYGVYITPQWDWVVQELLSDNDSRRATIAINQPYHKAKNPKDYPCTQYIQFLIRDNRLHMSVNMRSNDLVFGLCNDIFTFCLFQQLMLNELKQNGLDIELGKYFHHAGSLHVYERHYDMVNSICDSMESYSSPSDTLAIHDGINFANCMRLPHIDLSKEQMSTYVGHVEGVIFK